MLDARIAIGEGATAMNLARRGAAMRALPLGRAVKAIFAGGLKGGGAERAVTRLRVVGAGRQQLLM